MKTYSEFLSESILNEATDTFATKLGAALVEANFYQNLFLTKLLTHLQLS
ncbi:hypothetical protein [Escherichia phage BYEP02]|nr:hypothetical protein [Escherichia phage BYEP02]